MQWRVVDLLGLIAAVAVTFTLLRFQMLLAIGACPLIFGPLAGAVSGHSSQGAIAGLFAAIFWTLAVSALALHLALVAVSLDLTPVGKQQMVIAIPIVAYVLAAGTSILGGYLGGRAVRW